MSAEKENIISFYYRYLRYNLAKDDATATMFDKYMALSHAVRNYMVDRWINSQKKYHAGNSRRLYYLSMEYVFGKSLRQNIVNLGLENDFESAVEELGFSLNEIYEQEDNLDFGNGGKGRLAASIQDALATKSIASMGYGLRYDYTSFKQNINNGMQAEAPSNWLHKGHPWEVERPEYKCVVRFKNEPGNSTIDKDSDKVIAVPYDVPIPGYKNDTVNTVRLWSARASEEFLPDYQNHGDYVRACEDKSEAGRISKILFPDEDVRRATEMRIKQQFFFVSASLQDIIRRFKQHNDNILDLHKKVVIQLNGSRTAIAIAELMVILIDKEGLIWEDAWRITRDVFTYTSHAVSKKNLENWPVYLMEQVFPRHMKIIYEINQRHLDTVKANKKFDISLIPEVSLIEEGEVKRVRMAYLAILGSSYVNGVSRTQSERLVSDVFAPFANVIPSNFGNKTNGITHRRWLLCANKPLADLITEAIGDSWTKNPQDLSKLSSMENDSSFLSRLADVKNIAKINFADYANDKWNLPIDPESFFDVQSKKIHPYKRQMLHLLYIVSKYLQIKNGVYSGIKRCHIFSGKATPSDQLSKQIVYLINLLSNVINSDVSDKMCLSFIPDYNLTLAEYLVPSADLAEQISTVGLEASATSNMKFAINGAVTIASLSGSNLELIERIGKENIVSFGCDQSQIDEIGKYDPYQIIENNAELNAIFKFLDELLPNLEGGHLVYPLLSSLRDSDIYNVILDYEDYSAKQSFIDELYKNKQKWLSIVLRNIANIGWFSADRTVDEYASLVWNIKR